jgi:rhodanese-related sulfurtransferase
MPTCAPTSSTGVSERSSSAAPAATRCSSSQRAGLDPVAAAKRRVSVRGDTCTARAKRHFAARLAYETDAADVGAAVAAGDVDFILVDVRSREAYERGHIPGAISLPHREIDDIDLPEGLIVVYCWGPGCNAAQHAGRKLAARGRQVQEMLGGWEYYVREGFTPRREADPLVAVPPAARRAA